MFRSPSVRPWTAFVLLCAFSGVLSCGRDAMAQTSVSTKAGGGTRADYMKADTLSARAAESAVGGTVRPQWLGQTGGMFWYERTKPGNRREWLLVNAPTATRKPAFDHARLAAALSKAINKPVNAEQLPLDRVVLEKDGAVLRLRVAGQAFACDLTDYVLRPDDTPPSGANAFSPTRVLRRGSGTAGAETTITFVNKTATAVRLYWVSEPGRRQAYGTLAPGVSQAQHTFAGHVWLVTRDTDDIPLVAFAGSESPQTAVIDADTIAAVAKEERTPPGPSRPDAAFTSANKRFRVEVTNDGVRLRVMASPNAAPVVLAADGTENNRYEGRPQWSPDSRYFVVFQTVPGQEHKIPLVESSPEGETQPKLHLLDYRKPGDRIDHRRPRLFDAETGRAIAIPDLDKLAPNPWSIDDISWAPSGESFTFLYNERGHQTLRVVSVAAQTGEARTVIEEKSPTFVDYTNKVYFHNLPASHEAVWMSERDGWNHLYLYDTETGRVKNAVTPGPWVVREIERVDDTARQIWFWAGGIVPGQDPYYRHLCRVNFDGTGLRVLTDGDGTHTVTFSPDRRYLMDTWSRVDAPPVSVLREAETGKQIVALEQGNETVLRATGWLPPERFVAKGRDNQTDIYGVLYRPSNFDARRRYPVLESIYAGPQGASVPKAWSPANGAQQMAELGFVVVVIDGMGTNFRSKAFHDVCWKNLADAGLPDRVAWIRKTAQTRPYMDLNRVGIYGTSAGGQNALGALLTHGDFYKVAAADCGCHDNRMDKIWWNEQWMGWPVGPEYAANSNVTLAPNLTGKLLLMVGEMDSNVDPASTMQVVNALIKADKDFELLVMPGVGHGTAGTAYGKRRMRDFFVRNLIGAEPPAAAVR